MVWRVEEEIKKIKMSFIKNILGLKENLDKVEEKDFKKLFEQANEFATFINTKNLGAKFSYIAKIFQEIHSVKTQGKTIPQESRVNLIKFIKENESDLQELEILIDRMLKAEKIIIKDEKKEIKADKTIKSIEQKSHVVDIMRCDVTKTPLVYFVKIGKERDKILNIKKENFNLNEKDIEKSLKYNHLAIAVIPKKDNLSYDYKNRLRAYNHYIVYLGACYDIDNTNEQMLAHFCTSNWNTIGLPINENKSSSNNEIGGFRLLVEFRDEKNSVKKIHLFVQAK